MVPEDTVPTNVYTKQLLKPLHSTVQEHSPKDSPAEQSDQQSHGHRRQVEVD